MDAFLDIGTGPVHGVWAALAVILAFIIIDIYRHRQYPTGRQRLLNMSDASHEPHESAFLSGAFILDDASTSEDEFFSMPQYQPTASDIMLVKHMLGKCKKLVPEIVDQVLDWAEYWEHAEGNVTFDRDEMYIGGTSHVEDKLLLRVPPVGFPHGLCGGVDRRLYQTWTAPPKELAREYTAEEFRSLIVDSPPPTLEHPVRKVVFKIRSKDQGWGGRVEDRNTFRNSWTWFQAGLEQFDAAAKCESDGPNMCKADNPEGEGECSSEPGSDSTSSEPPSKAEPNNTSAEETRHGSEVAPGPNSAKKSSSFDSEKLPNRPKPEGDDPGEHPLLAIPLCALRPKIPPSVMDAQGNRDYEHKLQLSPEYTIQVNRVAHRKWQDYTIVWSWTDDITPDSDKADALESSGRGRATGTGEFVRNLKLGDVITVWGHARFPGWCNNVSRVGVYVYWAI